MTPLAGSKPHLALVHFELFSLLFWMCVIGVLNKYSGTRTDVDQEFVIMFTLVDENQSWYLDENIRHFCTDPDSVDKEDAVFQRSNKMHGEYLPCFQTHTDCILGIWYHVDAKTQKRQACFYKICNLVMRMIRKWYEMHYMSEHQTTWEGTSQEIWAKLGMTKLWYRKWKD